MTAPATAVFTYLWHYMLARLLYDELVRPMVHGHVPLLLLIVASGAVAGVLGRRRGRRT